MDDLQNVMIQFQRFLMVRRNGTNEALGWSVSLENTVAEVLTSKENSFTVSSIIVKLQNGLMKEVRSSRSTST